MKQELGVIPKVGWQLDPFGHSASQASLFTSQLGFDALYFGRIDYQDLKQRHEQQACEGLWNSSTNREDATVFWGLTGSYEGNYGSPQGYCFDIGCEDPLLVDMNHSELEYSIHRLLQELQVQSERTQGNHIMITMGSDFQVRSMWLLTFTLLFLKLAIQLYSPFLYRHFHTSSSINGLISTLPISI